MSQHLYFTLLSSVWLMASFGCASRSTASADAADPLRQQCAVIAPSLGMTTEELLSTAREARDRYKKIVDSFGWVDDTEIEIWLAHDERRRSGIAVRFIKRNGRWKEDQSAGGSWQRPEKQPNPESCVTQQPSHDSC